jgi:hypothetical protein
MVERNTLPSQNAVPGAAAVDDRATLLNLLHRLTEQLSTLFRQEVKLAAAEVSGTFAELAAILASMAGGAVVLYAGFTLLLFAAVLGLAYVLPMWLASLGVGLVTVVLGCVLLFAGKRKLAGARLAPSHSPASLRRDKNVLTRKDP